MSLLLHSPLRLQAPLSLSQTFPLSQPYTPTKPIHRAKRTGKQRCPSEKKNLKLKHKQVFSDVKNKFKGFWKLSKFGLSMDKLPGKDFLLVFEGLLEQIAKVLEFPVASMLHREAFAVVRKSSDARKVLKEPKLVYTVNMDVDKFLNLESHTWNFISRLKPKVGLVERMPYEN